MSDNRKSESVNENRKISDCTVHLLPGFAISTPQSSLAKQFLPPADARYHIPDIRQMADITQMVDHIDGVFQIDVRYQIDGGSHYSKKTPISHYSKKKQISISLYSNKKLMQLCVECTKVMCTTNFWSDANHHSCFRSPEKKGRDFIFRLGGGRILPKAHVSGVLTQE